MGNTTTPHETVYASRAHRGHQLICSPELAKDSRRWSSAERQRQVRLLYLPRPRDRIRSAAVTLVVVVIVQAPGGGGGGSVATLTSPRPNLHRFLRLQGTSPRGMIGNPMSSRTNHPLQEHQFG